MLVCFPCPCVAITEIPGLFNPNYVRIELELSIYMHRPDPHRTRHSCYARLAVQLSYFLSGHEEVYTLFGYDW